MAANKPILAYGIVVVRDLEPKIFVAQRRIIMNMNIGQHNMYTGDIQYQLVLF